MNFFVFFILTFVFFIFNIYSQEDLGVDISEKLSVIDDDFRKREVIRRSQKFDPALEAYKNEFKKKIMDRAINRAIREHNE